MSRSIEFMDVFSEWSRTHSVQEEITPDDVKELGAEDSDYIEGSLHMKPQSEKDEAFDSHNPGMDILSLPSELLELIFCFLEVADICALSQTCRHLRNVQSCNAIWKCGLFNTYPRLADRSCQSDLMLMLRRAGGSWRRLARRRARAGNDVCLMIDRAAERYYALDGVPDPAMEDFRQLLPRFGRLLSRDALLDVIYPRHFHPQEQLARRHYGRMLFREMERDWRLLPLFRDLQGRPGRMVLPEVLHLFGLWLVPELPENTDWKLRSYYHTVAGMVLRELHKTQPDHPIQAWTEPKQDPFGETVWHEDDVTAVLDGINAVLYRELALLDGEAPRPVLAARMHEFFSSNNSHGVAHMMPWLYSSVAGMLGVNTNLVRITDRTMVCWVKPSTGDYIVVDVSRHGFRLSLETLRYELRRSLPNMESAWLDLVSPHQLVARIALAAAVPMQEPCLSPADLRAMQAMAVWSRGRFVLDYDTMSRLADWLSSERPMYARRLVKEYIRVHRAEMPAADLDRMTEFVSSLRRLYRHLRASAAALWPTAWDLPPVTEPMKMCCRPLRQFRIGEIVIHRNGYLAAIYFCTSSCLAPTEWVRQNLRRDSLMRGLQQPFYYLLLDGDMSALAPEEELWLAPEPCPINHTEVGRYFVRFDGRRYHPVASLSDCFPDPRSGAPVQCCLRGPGEPSRARRGRVPCVWGTRRPGAWPPEVPEAVPAADSDEGGLGRRDEQRSEGRQRHRRRRRPPAADGEQHQPDVADIADSVAIAGAGGAANAAPAAEAAAGAAGAGDSKAADEEFDVEFDFDFGAAAVAAAAEGVDDVLDALIAEVADADAVSVEEVVDVVDGVAAGADAIAAVAAEDVADAGAAAANAFAAEAAAEELAAEAAAGALAGAPPAWPALEFDPLPEADGNDEWLHFLLERQATVRRPPGPTTQVGWEIQQVQPPQASVAPTPAESRARAEQWMLPRPQPILWEDEPEPVVAPPGPMLPPPERRGDDPPTLDEVAEAARAGAWRPAADEPLAGGWGRAAAAAPLPLLWDEEAMATVAGTGPARAGLEGGRRPDKSDAPEDVPEDAPEDALDDTLQEVLEDPLEDVPEEAREDPPAAPPQEDWEPMEVDEVSEVGEEWEIDDTPAREERREEAEGEEWGLEEEEREQAREEDAEAPPVIGHGPITWEEHRRGVIERLRLMRALETIDQLSRGQSVPAVVRPRSAPPFETPRHRDHY